MAEVDQYFLGYRRAEQERLQRQALELAPEAQWLFDQIGVRSGARADPSFWPCPRQADHRAPSPLRPSSLGRG